MNARSVAVCQKRIRIFNSAWHKLKFFSGRISTIRIT